jgi:uncharacterized protein
MSDETGDGLDRRDFMISSLATAGASAALVAAVGAANAQTAAAPAAKGTPYTGDSRLVENSR